MGNRNTKIKVVYLTTSYPMQSNPASGIFVYRLIKHMPELVNPVIVTPDSHSGKAILDNDIDVSIKTFRYAPKSWQLIAHTPGGIPVALNNNKFLYLILPFFLISEFLSTLYNSWQAQVIHANWSINGFIAGLVGILLRKPVVTTLRGEDITRSMKYLLDRIILKCSIQWSSCIVCVNYSYIDWIKETLPKSKYKLKTINNGVDNSFIEAGRIRLIHRVSSGSTFKILTVGSLIKRKRIQDIIETVNKFEDKDISVTIAGDGPEKESLNKLVSNLKISDRVKFVGTVNQDQLISLFNDHDTLVLCSESEGRPNVLLEAMAAGIPIIATDLPGISEFVTSGSNGFLFNVGEVNRLSNLIKILKSDTDLQLSIATKAHNYITENELTWNRSAQQYTELYESLLTSKVNK